MGILDRLFKHESQDENKNTPIKSESNRKIVDPNIIENAIAERAHSIQLNQCIKVPFTDVIALGSVFAELIPTFRTFVQSTTVSGIGYIPINLAAGDRLKTGAKGAYYYGSHVTKILPEGWTPEICTIPGNGQSI